MIIEEDELNRKLVADLLHMRGIRSVQSTSADDVETLFETHNPRLILLDAGLPKCAELKISRLLKLHPAMKYIPTILLTAYSDYRSQRLCSEYGCVDFLSKPLAINDFYNTIHKFLAPDSLAFAS